MAFLLFFAFIAGFITILSPCIWPILPIVLSASSAGGRQRPSGITLGLMTSFTLFTLSVSYVERVFHVDPGLFRTLAVVLLGLLGFSMLFPSFGGRLEDAINRLLAPFRSRLKGRGTGFSAGYVMGFATGLVWAPCSGPILATVATLAAIQEVSTKVVLVTLAYVSGLGVPLFFFALAGSWFFERMRRLTPYTTRLQQAFGLVTIAAAVLIYTNYDKALQLKVLDLFPSYGGFISRFEDNARVSRQLDALEGKPEGSPPASGETAAGLPDLGRAPDFTGIAHWLNTAGPLTMEQLRGKVVLIDFWTYTCINCVRTLPHLTAWDARYRDAGLVIVGVHTPEFAFEKETQNVANAVRQFHVEYPVAQDNDYATWRAYNNRYWPAEYLIDARGHIRRTHFGEGEYDAMEEAIRLLLAEAGSSVQAPAAAVEDRTPRYRVTPETYLGLARMERFDSGQRPLFGEQAYSVPSGIAVDHFAYGGTWDLGDEAATAAQGAELDLRFRAQKVFLVIKPRAAGDRVAVFLDGAPVTQETAGADVKGGLLTLDTQRLYEIIDLKGKAGAHLLRLEFEDAGVSVFAFTFG
ncbi:MAG: cytochrome c biogenesis protein DipZ [Deltaproteobacteria bacterium]